LVSHCSPAFSVDNLHTVTIKYSSLSVCRETVTRSVFSCSDALLMHRLTALNGDTTWVISIRISRAENTHSLFRSVEGLSSYVTS